MRRILNFITSISIWGVVFLVPLAFAPWTFEAFEFNKLFVLFSLVSIGTLAWFMRMVFVDREIRLKRSPLDLPIILFITLVNISSFFSSDRWSSVFGYYGRFSDSAAALGSLVGLYFLIINTVEKPQRLLNWFLGAVGVAVAASYLSLFNVWQQLSVWPIMKQMSFNPVAASLEGLCVFLAALMVFLVFQSVKPGVRIFERVLYLVLILSSLGILLLADVSKAWVILLLGLLAVLVGGLVVRLRTKERGGLKQLLLPLALLLVAIVFLFSPTSLASVIQGVPKEPMLSQGLSWNIAWHTATENVKNALLGSGPGTFAIDFSRHRPESFNMQQEWQTRFDRAGNHWSEMLATYGFLGFLAFFALVGFFLLASWFLLDRKNTWPFLIAVIVLLCAQLMYYQTFALGLAFWLFLALGVLSWERTAQEFVLSLRKFPELEFMAKAVFLVVFALAGGAGYFAARFYVADMNYLVSQNARADMTRRIDRSLEAMRLNPYQAEYKIFAARSYLSRALSELRKPESERDQVGISRDVQLAIAYARGDTLENNEKIQGATEISPKRVATWETLGAVYRDIKFAAGALEWAMRSFETAIALEPANPVLRTELGKLYVTSEQYDKARAQFEKAAVLKLDYVEAQLQLALVFEKEKDVNSAIAKMKDIALRYPLDTESLFQLGRLQYNNGQVEEAMAQFRQILQLVPSHSNARFALGVALEKQGNTQEAIAEFEKVLELNPGNEAVARKLQELKK
ncbi:MAG: tetratricopeptide repeat protein [Candidatus Wildermuthbacteria bacterium]|nr:tetratricopeptide repeat protein [Candidatus Wildermuthbacteria bacterium]